MGRSAQALTDAALQRVRDPNANLHSRVFVQARLTDAQRFLNAALGLVVDSASLTLNPFQSVYSLSGLLPNAVRVVGVREGGRDLALIPSITQLLSFSPRWTRDVGGRCEAWTTVGRDLLIVYPARTNTTVVTVYYAKLTAALAGETDLSDFGDEYGDMITTLTEAVLLLRQRDTEASKRAMGRLQAKLSPEVGAPRLHTPQVTQVMNSGQS
jgi:hypothetical protein